VPADDAPEPTAVQLHAQAAVSDYLKIHSFYATLAEVIARVLQECLKAAWRQRRLPLALQTLGRLVHNIVLVIAIGLVRQISPSNRRTDRASGSVVLNAQRKHSAA
jgi:hypothetical protein